MLTIRLANDDDQKGWEVYIAGHPQALLGHQFAWRAFFEETFKLTTHYWLAQSETGIVGIAPFVLRNHIGLGKRLTSLPYLNTGGILADDETIQAALWEKISLWAARERVASVELRGRYAPLAPYAVRQGRSASIIPLAADESAAWDSLRSAARNRIRKAEGHGLRAQHGFQHFEGFWRAYADNMLALGAPVLARRFFLNLRDTPALDPHLITLWHEGECVAGIVLLGFKDGAENGWTASHIAARTLYSNDLLYWEAMRWGVSRGLRWLDLGRSQVGGGHERFKEKFGAESIALPYQELAHDPQTNTWRGLTEEPEALYKTFTGVWKRLPLPLATRIGPYFSRQIY